MSPARCFRVRPPERLGERGRDAVAGRVDQLPHQIPARAAVGFTLGGYHPLADPQVRFYVDLLPQQAGGPVVGEIVLVGTGAACL